MIGLENRASVYVYARPTDMRESFFSLADLVKREMDRDPLSGDAFVFVNASTTSSMATFHLNDRSDGWGAPVSTHRRKRCGKSCQYRAKFRPLG